MPGVAPTTPQITITNYDNQHEAPLERAGSEHERSSNNSEAVASSNNNQTPSSSTTQPNNEEVSLAKDCFGNIIGR